MNYEDEIRDLLAVYPNVEVGAVEGYDFEMDRRTLTYLVSVGGVELQFLTYMDTEMTGGEKEDFFDSIEAVVNSVA